MVDQVIDAMDYAVYVYDVSHIVLDNLQFMLSGMCLAVQLVISLFRWCLQTCVCRSAGIADFCLFERGFRARGPRIRTL